MVGQLEALRLWNEQPDIAAWLESSRLNIARGMLNKAGEPRMAEASHETPHVFRARGCEPRKA